MKSFKHWKRQEVEETFGIEEVETHPLLEKWLKANNEISESESTRLEELRELLIKNVDLWNEAELKMKFLGPLLNLVNYDTKHYRAFMERSFSLRKADDVANGTVDFLIARGKQIPRSPFFCIHEYKSDPSASNDPLGQLLIGLVAIYIENQKKNNEIPLYGIYVVGRFFYFVAFDGTSYAKTLRAFDATKEDILMIYKMLKEIKIYINRIIEKEQGILV